MAGEKSDGGDGERLAGFRRARVVMQYLRRDKDETSTSFVSLPLLGPMGAILKNDQSPARSTKVSPR